MELTPSLYNKLLLLYLLPISFGLCYYFILSRKWNWIAQVVIGFTFGVSAGLGFKGIFVEFVPQLVKSFRPLYVPGDTLQTFSNLVFVVILVTAMSYFSSPLSDARAELLSALP